MFSLSAVLLSGIAAFSSPVASTSAQVAVAPEAVALDAHSSQAVTAQDSASTQAPAQDASPFPESTALAQGLSPDALAGLSDLIQGFVEDREIVGGELLVIQGGRTVLHQAYGLSDLEGGVPMRTDSVFCVRSMTKPLIGTAVLMLVDDRVIALDDKVSKYLPAFDVDGAGDVGRDDASSGEEQGEGTSGGNDDTSSHGANATVKFGPRDITIEQLLRHTSGLPMSLIARADLDALLGEGGIIAVAALGAAHGPETEPGTAF